jgi:chemotaxis protein CheD
MKEGVVNVRAGDLHVAQNGPTLVTIGLGSCVAVALYDPQTRVGGLAHVMLPDPTSARHPFPIGRFGTTAVPALLEAMERVGASRSRVTARLVGGAAMFANVLSTAARSLGNRNVDAVRKSIEDLGIPVVGEDVGADYGRTVYFHTDDGRVRVNSILHGDVHL